MSERDDDNMPERIWAGDFDSQGFGHCVAGMQGGLYAEYVRADLYEALRQQLETARAQGRDEGLEEAAKTVRVCDMGFDREMGPLGCSLDLKDGCICCGIATAIRALKSGEGG